MTDNEIRMDEIVEQLIRRYGIGSYVEQTGGGTATIYVGPEGEDGRWAVIAGPGWFEGPSWTEGRALAKDFYVGPDDHGLVSPWSADGADETAITNEIARQWRRFLPGMKANPFDT